MSDESNDVGSVKVSVSANAVHKAVRNILKNEMNLDVPAAKDEIRQQAFAIIKTEVIEYLSKSGYSYASLQDWARRAMQTRMDDVDKVLKQVVKELVHEQIHNEIIQVVEGIVKDGLEVRIGWNRKVKVKVSKE